MDSCSSLNTSGAGDFKEPKLLCGCVCVEGGGGDGSHGGNSPHTLCSSWEP